MFNSRQAPRLLLAAISFFTSLAGLSAAEATAIDAPTMQRVFDEVKTPFKYGIVLRGSASEKIDCPNIFRRDGRWYMVFIAFDGRG